MRIACRSDNDLCLAMHASGMPCERYERPGEAIAAARSGEGVLIFADGYPDAATPVEDEWFQEARRMGLRLYVEFPDRLEGEALGPPRGIVWERTVVASDAFAPALERMGILMIHSCRFVPMAPRASHLVLSRVAGFDTAVFGLAQPAWPILYEHSPRVLVATTKLSGFLTARYAPFQAWRAVWQWILAWCQEEEPATGRWRGPLACEATVRPSYGPREALPQEAQALAMARGARWFRNARLLIHPSWKDEAQRRLTEWTDGIGVGPAKDWPCGDGDCGMIEGANATILPDGSQLWRYHLRNDCMGETSMALALADAAGGLEGGKAQAANLVEFVYARAHAPGGPRGNPSSPSYGLVPWSSTSDCYYGDDNARCMLGTMAAEAALGSDRWDLPLMRCLLANLRTTGPDGFRGNALGEANLQKNGWRHYWTTPRTNYAPHYESWLWACFLWAYDKTQYAPFLQRARRGIAATMAAYPDQWRWTNGIQQERARMLLPLAWLVRVRDEPLHRQWLATMVGELLAGQDACGAIGEEIGSAGKGAYQPVEEGRFFQASVTPRRRARFAVLTRREATPTVSDASKDFPSALTGPESSQKRPKCWPGGRLAVVAACRFRTPSASRAPG